MFAIAENNLPPTIYPSPFPLRTHRIRWTGWYLLHFATGGCYWNRTLAELDPPRPIHVAIGSCWHISHWAGAGRCLDRTRELYVCSLLIGDRTRWRERIRFPRRKPVHVCIDIRNIETQIHRENVLTGPCICYAWRPDERLRMPSWQHPRRLHRYSPAIISRLDTRPQRSCLLLGGLMCPAIYQCRRIRIYINPPTSCYQKLSVSVLLVRTANTI